MKTLEREADVKALEETYPEAARNITRHYSGRRAHLIPTSQVTRETMVLESTVRAQDIAKEYTAIALDAGMEGEFRMVAGLGESHGEFDVGDSDHYGMGAQKLAAEYLGETTTLQAGLDAAREELSKTGLKESLQENLVGVKKKRKRFFNEHDGDWDLDRKWDQNPFMSTLLSKVEFPYIEIIFPINMNAGASARTISTFNARCLALAEIFESVGFRVAITAEGWQRNILVSKNENKRLLAELGGGSDYTASNENVEVLTRILIREANEYGDMQSFAVYSSVEFFRRTMFSMIYTPFHYVHGLRSALKNQVNESFGKALDARPIDPLPGQLVLTRDLVSQLFSMDKAESEKIFQERVLHVVTRAS